MDLNRKISLDTLFTAHNIGPHGNNNKRNCIRMPTGKTMFLSLKSINLYTL